MLGDGGGGDPPLLPALPADEEREAPLRPQPLPGLGMEAVRGGGAAACRAPWDSDAPPVCGVSSLLSFGVSHKKYVTNKKSTYIHI